MKHIFGVSADGHNILEIATSLRESIIELSGKLSLTPKIVSGLVVKHLISSTSFETWS